MSERLMIVGPGRAGLALGYALWQVDAVSALTYCGRRPEAPSHPLFVQGLATYRFGLEAPASGTTAVILAVPDEVLPEMAHTLAAQGEAPAGCTALHLSGARGADVLAPLHARGYAVGTLHPLQSLAHPVTGADRLPGSTFAVSGEPAAIRSARRLAGALDGFPVTVPVAQRPAYHAAAVLASNHLTALMAVAGRLLARSGVPGDRVVDALLPLVRGTVDNIEQMGLGHALTGPLARGDVETVELHLRSLEPRERQVYRALGGELARLAREWEVLDPDRADEMEYTLRPGVADTPGPDDRAAAPDEGPPGGDST